MRKIIGAVASSIRDKFVDTFDRADSTGGLGTASDGSLWNVVRGNLGITSNKATMGTGDTANAYPASSVKMPKTDVTISMTDTGIGGGSLLWVTDSNNWWATDVYQYSYSVNNYTSNATGNYYCNQTSTNYFCNVPFYSCNRTGQTYNGYVCNGFNSNNIKNTTYCKGYTLQYTANYFCSLGCNAYGSSTNCVSGTANYTTTLTGTTYYYPTYIRILQSVANVVSTINSVYVGDTINTIVALKTLISGTTITARGYSDNSMTTQVGSDLVYNATGAAVTAEYGIVITPSGSNAVNAIGAITIE
jgi:hypothetical protein